LSFYVCNATSVKLQCVLLYPAQVQLSTKTTGNTMQNVTALRI